MKSEHRHELKTNELAEWLSNLPQWTKENRTTIIVVLAVVVAAAAFYVRYRYRKNAVAQEQLEFTNLLNQLSTSKIQVLNAQAQGRDLSFILLQPANSLGNFAQSANNDRMAALALIKQAEALRTELHYRPGTVSNEDLTSQINQAKAAYTEAKTRLRRASSASLMAAAEFGLGLCEEELSNFEKAHQIYQDIAANPDFEGAVAVAQAKHRLETMADYKQKVVFKPAPIPPAAPLLPGETTPGASQPMIQIMPSDTIQPTEVNLPVETNLPAEANLPVDVNLIPQTTDNISIQVIPLSNQDVLALSANDVEQVIRRAGLSHRQIFEYITDVRNGLAQSGAVQIKINNKVEAVFAIRGDSVYISTRKRGNFIYNVNTDDNNPEVPDANLPPPVNPDNQIDGPNNISKDSEDSR